MPSSFPTLEESKLKSHQSLITTTTSLDSSCIDGDGDTTSNLNMTEIVAVTLESRPERQIHTLLWLSLNLALLSLAPSMVVLGTTTLYITPGAVLLTTTFSTTLLVLSARARKVKATTHRLKSAAGVEFIREDDSGVEEDTAHGPQDVPVVFRKRTILFMSCLLLLWLASIGWLVVGIVFLAPKLAKDHWRSSLDADERRTLISCLVEVAVDTAQVGVSLAAMVLAIKGRRHCMRTRGRRTRGEGGHVEVSLEKSDEVSLVPLMPGPKEREAV